MFNCVVVGVCLFLIWLNFDLVVCFGVYFDFCLACYFVFYEIYLIVLV